MATPAQRALAAAIVASKKAPGAPLREQFTGRVDRTICHRLAAGNRAIFQTAGSPAPSKIRLAIVLDGSGSMGSLRSGSHKAVIAVALGTDLAGATTLLRNVSATVWVHTASHGNVTVKRLWRTGQPLNRITNGYMDFNQADNADGVALNYIGDRLLAELRPGEQGLIIMVSDGKPIYSGSVNRGNVHLALKPKERDELIRIKSSVTREEAERLLDEELLAGAHATLAYMNLMKALGLGHTASVVKKLRQKHIPVVSVAIDSALTLNDQIAMYGREATIPYSPNTQALARQMAKAVGKVMAGV